MSLTVLGSNGGGAYNLESSLRFRRSALPYLERTPSSSAGLTKFTNSFWIKRGKIVDGETMVIFSAGVDNNNRTFCFFNATTHVLRFFSTDGGVNRTDISWDLAFRDPSAWYHIVLIYDESNATTADKLILYVNGVRRTGTFTTTPTGGHGQWWGNSTYANYIGRRHDLYPSTNQCLDAYLTEFHYVPNQTLTADDFGEYDEDTGVWKPKQYTGTYGTNGFYLDMSTSSSTVLDQSSNSNNWTASNMNLTTSSATTYDIMNDVATLTDEDTANFATLNPVSPLSTSTLQDGNLQLNSTSSSWKHGISTIALPNTGKWYFEMSQSSDNNNCHMGIAPVESLANGSNGYVTDAILTNTPNADGVAAGGLAGSTGTWTGTYNISAGDTLACAVDMDADKVWFRIGSNWVDAGSGAGNPSAGTNPAVSGGINSNKTYHFIASAYAESIYVNFGQRPFAYTPPTGYKKLNTYNLPDSTIVDGSQYFDAVTYTGDGNANRVINTSINFSTNGLAWFKARSNSAVNADWNNHFLVDSLRTYNGTPYFQIIRSSGTNAESPNGDVLKNATSTSFQKGSGLTNENNIPYVGWLWQAGATSSSNTDGTITSTVSANPTAGFSIVSYTGNSTNGATIGHGLGVEPKIVIVKNRDGGWQWIVDISNITGTTSDHLILNSTSAKSSSNTYFSAKPTSTVFSVNGASYSDTGTSPYKYIAYCFADVEGFSKMGSYEGNGSADGPFVYTGFRPAFILFKNADDSRQWGIVDTSRSTYNQTNATLEPSTSNAENPYDDFDILSNGFKPRTTDPGSNRSGYTIIYMAFAENPFKNSLAR